MSFTVEGLPQELPGGADLAAYRVIQESLTNTRKHGGPSASALGDPGVLRGWPDAVHRRRRPGCRGRPRGRRHGLTGMRERAELYGGTVRSGPRPGGGYQVTATLPFTVPALPGPADLAGQAGRAGRGAA